LKEKTPQSLKIKPKKQQRKINHLKKEEIEEVGKHKRNQNLTVVQQVDIQLGYHMHTGIN
jgi:hypothetical protein